MRCSSDGREKTLLPLLLLLLLLGDTPSRFCCCCSSNCSLGDRFGILLRFPILPRPTPFFFFFVLPPTAAVLSFDDTAPTLLRTAVHVFPRTEVLARAASPLSAVQLMLLHPSEMTLAVFLIPSAAFSRRVSPCPCFRARCRRAAAFLSSSCSRLLDPPRSSLDFVPTPAAPFPSFAGDSNTARVVRPHTSPSQTVDRLTREDIEEDIGVAATAVTEEEDMLLGFLNRAAAAAKASKSVSKMESWSSFSCSCCCFCCCRRC